MNRVKGRRQGQQVTVLVLSRMWIVHCIIYIVGGTFYSGIWFEVGIVSYLGCNTLTCLGNKNEV